MKQKYKLQIINNKLETDHTIITHQTEISHPSVIMLRIKPLIIITGSLELEIKDIKRFLIENNL